MNACFIVPFLRQNSDEAKIEIIRLFPELQKESFEVIRGFNLLRIYFARPVSLVEFIEKISGAKYVDSTKASTG